MENKKRVLVVDDSPNEVRILMEILKQDYAVVAATSGEKAIDLVKGDNPPDLILMDVNMEPMNGYEACSKILEINNQLPVIFVSSNTQTDEILQGFDVGGVDYITKPIDGKVLLSKVGLVLKSSDRHQALEIERDNVSSMVWTAMSSVGKLNVVLNFVRNGLKVHSHQELAELIEHTFKEFDLDGCVQVRALEVINASTGPSVNPLEAELLDRSVNMTERILENGKRMIIRYDSVTLLIKNMPVEDESLRGDLRDYLAIIAEDAKNFTLMCTQDLDIKGQRSSMVSNALNESKAALMEIEAYQKEHKQSSINIMDDLMREVENSYFEMGLTDNQEQVISSIIQQKVQEALDHMEGGLDVDKKMKTITQSLGEIAKSLEE